MRRVLVSAAVALLAISACGGDGGGATTVPTVTTTAEGDPDAPGATAATTSVPTDAGVGEPIAYVMDLDGLVHLFDGAELSSPIAEITDAAGFIWAAHGDAWVGHREMLIHIDATGDELGTVPEASPAFGFGAGEDAVYVLSGFFGTDTRISKVDPESNAVLASLESEEGEWFKNLAYGGGLVWVSWGERTENETAVARIDPDTMQIIGTTETTIRPEALAFGEGSLWVAGPVLEGEPGATRLFRIGGDGEIEAEIEVSAVEARISIVAGLGGVWLLDAAGTDVVRIDPATNTEVARITVGEPTDSTLRTTRVHIGAGRVWASNHADRHLYEIDPESNQVVASYEHRAWRAIAFL